MGGLDRRAEKYSLEVILIVLALFSSSAYAYTPNELAECRMASSWLAIVFMNKGDFQGKKVFDELSEKYFNYVIKHLKKFQQSEYLDRVNTLNLSYQAMGSENGTNYAKSVMSECVKYQLN